MADPTSSTAAEPGTDTAPGPAVAPDGGPEPTAPAPGDGGADLARRRFFREFAGEIASTAATVLGAAQTPADVGRARRRSSTRPGSTAPRRRWRSRSRSRRTGRDRTGFPDRVPDGRRDDLFVDQRTLPSSLTEYAASSAAEVTYAIRNGTLLGGPAAGQAAALGMALTAARVHATKPYARRATFRGAANAMRNAAPASGSVEAAMNRVMAAYASVGELSEDGDAIAAAMQSEADAIVAEAVADHGRLVEAGVALLAGLPRGEDAGPLRVLVHGPGGTLAAASSGPPDDRHHRPSARDPHPGRRPGGPAALHREPDRLLGAGRGRRPPARRRRGRAVADRRGRDRRRPDPGRTRRRERRRRRRDRDVPLAVVAARAACRSSPALPRARSTRRRGRFRDLDGYLDAEELIASRS
jgi:hypothetical protein